MDNPDDIVIHAVAEVRVYLAEGGVAISQADLLGDEPDIVVIPENRVSDLIRALEKFA